MMAAKGLLPSEMTALAEKVIRENKAQGRTVAVAESCTGGLVSAALTEIAGSSAVFMAGFITYSNEAKAAMLGVDTGLIESCGAVSCEVAEAMARGAAAKSNCHVAVSISGIAGPGGGSAEKPVGTVTFGIHRDGHTKSHRKQFGEGKNRADIRSAAAVYALELLLP